MRTQLQIGEVAQLLGVTPKTIRHYQKVGLINEPERTDAGYRLYDASDLLRIRYIRRLQSFGLSLKQIKTILGEPLQHHTLREVLQELDRELLTQIHELEERRQKIKGLLADETFDALDLPPGSPTFMAVKQLLEENLGELKVSPAALAQEEKMDAMIDNFNWSTEYKASMLGIAQHFVERPELYASMIALGERLAALADLPEDAPQVELVLAEMEQDHEEISQLVAEIAAIQAQWPQLEQPFTNTLVQYPQTDRRKSSNFVPLPALPNMNNISTNIQKRSGDFVLGDLMATTLSPAQKRFLQEMGRRFSFDGVERREI
jgi:DNA-binding transcriptional MerR regulator